MFSTTEISNMVSHWFPAAKKVGKVHEDTTEFFSVDYGDVILLGQDAYLVHHNAKEGRFGLDDEVKYWVKHAIDLKTGQRKIIKLEFFEKFDAKIGGFTFQCFRSPRKEARILNLVSAHPHFMHGHHVKDSAGNIVRVIDHIYGKSLHSYIQGLSMSHEEYFSDHFPTILKNYITCVEAIAFLHQNNEKHGDIRRDHILLDREADCYRWIDFDYTYRHKENIYSYDLFGLGNILTFLVGKGDVLLQDLKKIDFSGLNDMEQKDMNIVFKNRVANLKKVYPYIPERLNRILLHFSLKTEIFYDRTSQLLDDLKEAADLHSGLEKEA